MAAQIVLRTAVPSDIAGIMAIEEACFLPGVRERSEVYLSRIATFPEGFLVAYRPSDSLSMIGCICSEMWSGARPVVAGDFTLNHDPRKAHDPDGRLLYVSSTGVLPALRGQGIGRLLLLELLKRSERSFPHLRQSVLIVADSWLPARHIYQTAGYVERFRIRGFFSPEGMPAEDGIVMDRSYI